MGADVTLEGKWNELSGTPLDFAVQRNYADMIKVLEESKGDITQSFDLEEQIENELAHSRGRAEKGGVHQVTAGDGGKDPIQACNGKRVGLGHGDSEKDQGQY